MEKVEITISLDKERMEALEIFLKLEDTTPKKQLSSALLALYEQKVPEQVKSYIEARQKAASHPRHAVKPHTAAPVAGPKAPTLEIGTDGHDCEEDRE